ATSVYGMDHTGDATGSAASSDVNGGADAPIESGSRSRALLAELAGARVARARAEAREAELMVQIDHARAGEASVHDDPRIRSLEASSAADDIGLTMGLTAGSISNRLDEYSLMRTHLPGLWPRHLDGQIDGWRLHVIAEAAAQLLEPAKLTLLDDNLAGWLDRGLRTPGQLRAWLGRQVARLEPERRRERKESAWKERRADISHEDRKSTAHLFSVLSADDGIAIQDMIDQIA